MKVELLAYTVVTGWGAMRDAGWVDHICDHVDEPPDCDSIECDELAEFAGRLCYQSWDRPNPATATNAGYLANILRQEHFSVLEHASATFYVAGVSRSLSHELVRHRHLSFSQVSQRYVDERNARMIMPPTLEPPVDPELAAYMTGAMGGAQAVYQAIVETLTANGRSRKEARQAARSVLPNATETKFVVTGNMRAWRDVIVKRNSDAADAEIRALAAEILRQLKEIAPNTFQDM